MHTNELRAHAPIPIINSIAPISEGKQAWLVDVWGVMHDGVAPFEAAVAACESFKATGGSVLLISNAPRPAASVVQQLERIGVSATAYDGVVSSGDVALKLIADLGDCPVFHLGPDRDLAIYDASAVRLAPRENAQAIVCTGLFDDETETPETYRAMLEDMVSRGLEMICANPDIKVERGGKLVYCAGALARLYEALGGRVSYAGKPYPPIYKMACLVLASLRGMPVAADDLLAIGDGVHTDIQGAGDAGIDAIFIASGVHVAGGRLSESVVSQLFTDCTIRPAAAMRALRW